MKNFLELVFGYAYFAGLTIAGVACLAAFVYYLFEL